MRRTLSGIGLAVGMLMLVPHASAQTITMGSNQGSKCFRAITSPYSSAKRAEKICTKALDTAVLDTRNKAAAYVNRGIARMRQNKAELALADFAKAKNLRPNLPDLYINEGAVLVHLERYEDALISLTKAVEFESDNLHIAYLNLGLAREGLGDYEGAMFDIARAAQLAPDWSIASKELSRFQLLPDELQN